MSDEGGRLCRKAAECFFVRCVSLVSELERSRIGLVLLPYFLGLVFLGASEASDCKTAEEGSLDGGEAELLGALAGITSAVSSSLS